MQPLCLYAYLANNLTLYAIVCHTCFFHQFQPHGLRGRRQASARNRTANEGGRGQGSVSVSQSQEASSRTTTLGSPTGTVGEAANTPRASTPPADSVTNTPPSGSTYTGNGRPTNTASLQGNDNHHRADVDDDSIEEGDDNEPSFAPDKTKFHRFRDITPFPILSSDLYDEAYLKMDLDSFSFVGSCADLVAGTASCHPHAKCLIWSGINRFTTTNSSRWGVNASGSLRFSLRSGRPVNGPVSLNRFKNVQLAEINACGYEMIFRLHLVSEDSFLRSNYFPDYHLAVICSALNAVRLFPDKFPYFLQLDRGDREDFKKCMFDKTQPFFFQKTSNRQTNRSNRIFLGQKFIKVFFGLFMESLRDMCLPPDRWRLPYGDPEYTSVDTAIQEPRHSFHHYAKQIYGNCFFECTIAGIQDVCPVVHRSVCRLREGKQILIWCSEGLKKMVDHLKETFPSMQQASDQRNTIEFVLFSFDIGLVVTPTDPDISYLVMMDQATHLSNLLLENLRVVDASTLGNLDTSVVHENHPYFGKSSSFEPYRTSYLS